MGFGEREERETEQGVVEFKEIYGNGPIDEIG